MLIIEFKTESLFARIFCSRLCRPLRLCLYTLPFPESKRK